MARAVAAGADRFVITSDNPRNEDPMAILMDIERGLAAKQLARGDTIPDRTKAIRHVIERIEPGDALVIAGKGHENYQIIGSTKHHFDDVEVAAAAIEARARLVACAR
jgi:UDP-N-acetylmuramoyl-L-alanyl-D-glutamate--2,6-diaminopimelate ligase